MVRVCVPIVTSVSALGLSLHLLVHVCFVFLKHRVVNGVLSLLRIVLPILLK